MKKILVLLLAILFSLPSIANANVDATNAFDYDYKCSDGQGVLEARFNLGGHHRYYRTYYINQAGILEIADSAHTTLSKAANVSIPGCGNAGKCDITTYGDWEVDGADIDLITLKINADVPAENIRKTGDIITITNVTKVANGKDYKDITFDVTGENLSEEVTSNEKFITLDFSVEGKIIIEHGDSDDKMRELFTTTKIDSTTYGNKKDIRFEFSGDNKTIILKRTPLKRVNNGLLNEGASKLYYASSGKNYGDSTAGPSGYDNNYVNGYTTGLYKWPHSNSNFAHTTTNVRVHPSSTQACEEIEYNYKDNDISVEGTITSLIAPEFGGPVTINGVAQGQQGGNYSGLVIMATDKLNIRNLRYLKVGKTGNKEIGVNKVEVSIKTKDDITRGRQEIAFGKIYSTIGAFDAFDVNLPDVTKKKGNYVIVFTMFNSSVQVGSYEFPLTIIPNNEFVLKVTDVTKSVDPTYANGDDYVRICQNFTDSYDNTIARVKDIQSSEFISRKTNSVIVTSDANYTIISNVVLKGDSKFCFDVSKLAPGPLGKITIYIPTHRLDVNLALDGNSKQFILDFGDGNGNSSDGASTGNVTTKDLTDTKLIFANPFRSKIEVKNLNGETWDGIPDVAKNQNYRLVLENIGKLESVTNGSVNITSTSVKNLTEGHVWENFTTKTAENIFTIANHNLTKDIFLFDARIDINPNSGNEKAALDAPKVTTDNIMITYTIKGQRVTYPLANTELTGCEKSTLGVKVEGIIQSDGKGAMTGQEENFSDLSTSTMRTIIRRNAYTLITGMTSGQILNGIRYVEGDVVLGGNISGYETLIVKNGNVIINSDLNTALNKLGIIVLKDSYNINTDYGREGNKGAGNIYIGASVKKINAIVYADGTMRSADANGISIPDAEILEPLELTGSIFTRNTIGGVLKAGTSYTLPGEQKTTNYELASMFDLNQVRKTPICGDDQYAFLIKYDPKIQTNPPIGFTGN